MRLTNFAIGGAIIASFAMSSGTGCSAEDPNNLTDETQAATDDLRAGCPKRDEDDKAPCNATCAARGESDDDHHHVSKSCRGSGSAGSSGKPTGTSTGTAPPPSPPPPPAPTDAGSPPPPAPTTCTSFTYSAWGPCQNGTQTRTVVSSSPAGCTGGSPVLSQACTAIDGAALYAQYCSNCHGNSKKGSSASSIQSAINNNVGGMGSLKSLTPAEIAAIAAAP